MHTLECASASPRLTRSTTHTDALAGNAHAQHRRLPTAATSSHAALPSAITRTTRILPDIDGRLCAWAQCVGSEADHAWCFFPYRAF